MSELPTHSADIYFRMNGIYVLPRHELVTGLRIGGLPAFRTESDPKAEELGQAVLSAFLAKRTGLALTPPKVHNKLLRTIAKQAGCKSWKEFENTSMYCTAYLWEQNGHVEIWPSHHDPKYGGFVGKKEDPHPICSLDAKDIGATLLRIRQLLT